MSKGNRLQQRLLWLAEQEVSSILRRLPPELAEQSEKLVVSYERVPDDDLVEDGFDPGTLALFEGEAYAEEGSSNLPLPPRIILFLDNIWDEAGADEEEYRLEVRKSYLHELGHYLGLGEGDLELRGLE